MKIEHRMIRIPAPHCSECGERLFGNGSDVAPYTCSECGLWRFNELSGEYYLAKKAEKNPAKKMKKKTSKKLVQNSLF